MIYFDAPLPELKKYGPWMHVSKFLDDDECDRILDLMKINLHEARVSEAGDKNASIRSAKVTPLAAHTMNSWVIEKLADCITSCNRDIYKFDILGFAEAIQLIRYDKDDHYDWHQDFSNLHHSTRKLSISVQLSDPKDYTGGDLEFFRNGIAPKNRGDLILFPSFMAHKVHPIISGSRSAMVGWVSGAPYR